MIMLEKRLWDDDVMRRSYSNTFCDQICDVRTKRCYPNQIVSCHSSAEALTSLPDELERSEYEYFYT